MKSNFSIRQKEKFIAQKLAFGEKIIKATSFLGLARLFVAAARGRFLQLTPKDEDRLELLNANDVEIKH